METVMRHESGLHHFGRAISLEEVADMQTLSEIVASATPDWDYHIETDRAYHAITRGFILNCLFTRVDPQRRTIGQFVKQEISDQLDLDIYLGLDAAAKWRRHWHPAPMLRTRPSPLSVPRRRRPPRLPASARVCRTLSM